jgi:conjugative relaxase-like TrwC/TraI family protein
VAWMRMMGADSVAYHRETVVERGDDYPGRALEYYASRGETPLVWGGSGAADLGLGGSVIGQEYDAIFGPGGAVDPASGDPLVAAKRPGLELVVAAHKSVALLGVVGRADDMHAILDAETDATLAYLDAWMIARGGRRGRAQTRTPTHGLIWARTRHATSRAGDPEPHDHVLIANACRMADRGGGWKALDTAALRDLLHAATAAGRMASAAKAVSLGYAIEPDDGPSGRLGHWRIAGMPERACELFSKRAAEITAAVESKGYDTYQARQTAARDTRKAKRHTPPDDLLAGWRAELAAVGFTPAGVLADIDAAGAAGRRMVPARLSDRQLSALVAYSLGPAGRLAERKVFTRSDVVVAVAPLIFGAHPGELGRAVDAVCAHPDAVSLIGVAAARERAYAPACVLAVETAIAVKVAAQSQRTDFAALSPVAVCSAISAKQEALGGRSLTPGQVAMITGVCTSGRGVELVLGVAGAGKTTAIDVVRAGFEAAGYRVIGTSISGQATRTLGAEAQIAESRTTASLLWRLDHGQLALNARSVIVADEAGLADDPSVLRLLAAAETAGAKVVMVGDHRQLGAVGPGGSLGALVGRHGDGVHILDENVRQVDPDERAALGELRAGNVEAAVDWYAKQHRIAAAPTREGALDATVAEWAVDVDAGRDTTMLAWRRANVAALNARARAVMADTGRLTGPELDVDGTGYRAGDRIVTLAPGTNGDTVTSQRGVVTAVDVDSRSLLVCMDDEREHRFGPDDIGADRLAHGYATTVHRSQGATVDTTHLFADGGGRELGYVAMSRARQASHVHAIADSPDQAVEDLVRDWSVERRQTWAIDTGQPDPGAKGPLAVEADPAAPAALRATLGRGRLKAERDALVATLRAEPPAEPQAAFLHLKELDGRISRLNRRLEPQPPLQRAAGYTQGGGVPEPAERGVTPEI